ncbi:uncharacterized protein PV09_07830 [Verruconis gallopava]|uniref:Uncharacterized protein n=1 Tax=Verruconis gallopava TaxID=253628 RepID=A0A0D1XEM1_9PEZI|nr:uncharacterized protein PV09_07830 [Verruconis gallopava]KIW00636.1 hypothetical protein PV09_07830 [Verruconis gallopava]
MSDPNSNFYEAIRCLQGTKAERTACRNACTVDTCPLILSFWNYLPDVPLNSAFAGLFGIYTITVLLLGIYVRKFRTYTAVIFVGELMEVFGFVARVYAHAYPFSDAAYIMQMVCLTLAPTFMAAGIYFSLQRLVITFSGELSRIPPLWIPRVFIVCDILSLFLQGMGGALAAYYASQQELPDKGNYTMISGLSFQALTLLLFLTLAVDYAFRLWRFQKNVGWGVLNQDPIAAGLRESKRIKWLISSLTISGILIFFRSIYRVLELSEGWKGFLMSSEKYVVGLETIPVIIAGGLLAVLHPGFCFQGEDDPIPLRRKVKTPPRDPEAEPLYTIRRWNEKTGKIEIEVIYEPDHPIVRNLQQMVKL